MTVRTEGRKTGTTGEIWNTIQVWQVNGRREKTEACTKERKGERLCPEDEIDAGRICKTQETDVFD